MSFKLTQVSVPAVLFVIITSVLIASCAPPYAYTDPPASEKRTAALICAKWCLHCDKLHKTILPLVKEHGLLVSKYSERKNADLHVLDFDNRHDHQVIHNWQTTHKGMPQEITLPMLLVFERGEIVDTVCGSFGEIDIYRALNREDLIPKGAPPTPLTPPPPAEPVADQFSQANEQIPPTPEMPNAISDIATYLKQAIEFFGNDEATVRLTLPGGRTIHMDAANALVKIPDALDVTVRSEGELIFVQFVPSLKAEAIRWHIRVGTTIPSVVFSQDSITAKTGLGVPIRFKLDQTPFAEQSNHVE